MSGSARIVKGGKAIYGAAVGIRCSKRAPAHSGASVCRYSTW